MLGAPRLVQECRRGLEYDLQFDGAGFVIRTNAGAPNFHLVRAPPDNPGRDAWRTLWEPELGAYLEDFEVVRGAVAVTERVGGAMRGRVVPVDGGGDTLIDPTLICGCRGSA